MNVVVIAPYATGCSPGQRFRFEQWIDLLAEADVDFDIRPLFSRAAYRTIHSRGHLAAKVVYTIWGIGRRVTDLPACGRADTVLLYREMFPIGPPLLEKFVARRTPVVYDFDDAIFLKAINSHNRIAGALKQPAKVRAIIQVAAHTTVGNEYLAQYARMFNQHVTVLPTTLDTVVYSRPPDWARPPGPLRIGWIGSSTTTAYLHSIDGALRRLLTTYNLELVVIGGGSYSLPDVPNVVSKPWARREEINDVLTFDIGIMPLIDDEFARGKCGFKALLYMALEVPCVVSPVGVNASIVQDGHNGFLASTDDEWVIALQRLVEDDQLRARLAAAGRRTVVDGYDGRSIAPEFLRIHQQAALPSSRLHRGEDGQSKVARFSATESDELGQAAFLDAEPFRYLSQVTRRMSVVKSLVGQVEQGQVIDLGCGDGRISLQFLNPATSITLVDTSRTMLQQASRGIPDSCRSQVRLVRKSISELDSTDQYDLVLAIGILAHVGDLPQALALIAALVSPRGRLIVQLTDAATIPGAAITLASRLRTSRRGYRLNRLTEEHIVHALSTYNLVLADRFSYLTFYNRPSGHRFQSHARTTVTGPLRRGLDRWGPEKFLLFQRGPA